ncbi:MAG: tetratricopeptide repeat protein [Bdellovibrionales bacterium]|nr:tetratricopeptide repeat protein [Bdellovibrionales bacterium]
MADVDLSEVERYLKIFQENPDSRVFAPLADMYRRLGRLKEAEDICREGLMRHPYYAGGKVALAHILLEAGRYDEAQREAESVVTYYPDNLLARKILIRTLGALGHLDIAKREFEALKHLAPMVAGDPELERALQGKATAHTLPERPTSGKALGGAPVFKPIQLQEKTDWDPSRGELTVGSVSAAPGRQPRFQLPPTPAPPPPPSPGVLRSQKLSGLLRKKLILESLLRKLEA